MKGCGNAPGGVADPSLHHVAGAVLLMGGWVISLWDMARDPGSQ